MGGPEQASRSATDVQNGARVGDLRRGQVEDRPLHRFEHETLQAVALISLSHAVEAVDIVAV
jgi:hypothetical protein